MRVIIGAIICINLLALHGVCDSVIDSGDFSLVGSVDYLEEMDLESLLAHAVREPDTFEDRLKQFVPYDWTTKNRSDGMCAMYGSCWGDPLKRVINCPYNVPAVMVRNETDKHAQIEMHHTTM